MAAPQNIAEKLAPLGLSFPLPADTAWQRDLTKREELLLPIFALSAIYTALSSNVASQVPSPSKKPVTDAVTLLAAASAKPRKVVVYNNGADDVIILEGGSPGFIGQSGNLPSGNFTVDFGIVLESGDFYESPVAHTAAVNARCRAGESTSMTVTVY